MLKTFSIVSPACLADEAGHAPHLQKDFDATAAEVIGAVDG